MQHYQGASTLSGYQEALQVDQVQHDTRHVRSLVDQYRSGGNVRCVWTNRALQARFAVDHCFPWSRCGNNDLWNLMPATSHANNLKGDRLPSASLLHDARERITDWWEQAFTTTQYRDQFFVEASAALPATADRWRLDSVFEGLLHQRRRVRMNQQLAEWYGLTRS